jgi:20S proteasome subunit beta 7
VLSSTVRSDKIVNVMHKKCLHIGLFIVLDSEVAAVVLAVVFLVVVFLVVVFLVVFVVVVVVVVVVLVVVVVVIDIDVVVETECVSPMVSTSVIITAIIK